MESDSLTHYGVKGMKWGVRKDQDVVYREKLKSGGELTVVRKPTPAISRLLSKVSKSYKESSDRTHTFSLKGADGKTVGDATFTEDGPDSLNLAWIFVKKGARGNGYASSALRGVIEYAQDKGLTKLTLEVPGVSPDALHIYEKLGFKVTGQLTEDDDFWGGLTSMELNLPKGALKHADIDIEELVSYMVDSIDRAFPSELKHYGVKGMKWGVRKDRQGKNAPSKDYLKAKQLRKRKPSEMSNKNLREVNKRLELEANYRRLDPNAAKKGLNWIAAGASTATLGISIYNMAHSPAGKAALEQGKKLLSRGG